MTVFSLLSLFFRIFPADYGLPVWPGTGPRLRHGRVLGNTPGFHFVSSGHKFKWPELARSTHSPCLSLNDPLLALSYHSGQLVSAHCSSSHAMPYRTEFHVRRHQPILLGGI
jgi:hypothetical protein